jgi:LAS superfamily LD-carboxypeptidase LdcB
MRKKVILKVLFIVAIVVLGCSMVLLHHNKQYADTSGDWRLVLVDKGHYIPKDYWINLTRLSNGKQVDSRIYPSLQKMFNAARASGLALFVREGYRTFRDQKQIMNEKIRDYENQGNFKWQAARMAEKYVAIPGTSEHELGVSVDINADQTRCSSEKVYRWLDDHAYKYGFIKRYPSDKSYITGINNEPWHYRYVGREAAATMKAQNLCLEEYLKKYK